jgi:eukaryotic-like serine/threonine-protein kinase
VVGGAYPSVVGFVSGGSKTMLFRDRLQWILRMSLMAFILASVAFLSALTAVRFAIQGREVAMPDVVGMKAIEAQQTLRSRGVGIKVEDRIYNALPVDVVVRQSPAPGSRVKTGQYAHVMLSLGPQKATIPALVDHSLRAARIELLRGGMQLGEISSAYLPVGQHDAVIQQQPTPGTSDATSPHIDLLVSLGSRPPAYVMPEMVGLSLAEAESKLVGSGLKVSKLTFSPFPGILHGTVATQTPARGARVDSNATIEIQLAE